MPNMQRFIRAGKIFTGDAWLQDHAVQVEGDRISAVLPDGSIPADAIIEDHGDSLLVPALIDVQLYGAHGRLLAVYPEPQTLQLTYDYCLSGGAVLFLPTVATNTTEVFHQSIDAVRAYWQQGGKGVFGLHIEGPWLDAGKKGAHVAQLIHSPSVQEVKELLAYGRGVIKMITLAPEVCSAEVIRLLVDEGIILSAGHSNASYREALLGFDRGIAAITHLYNAMSGLHHREPGLVGAAFLDQRVSASVIPDGHHVDYEAIRIAKRMMGERLFAITDAVTETSSGYYRHELAGDKYECNDVLSGSALTMHKCLVNLVHHVGIETGEALRMCSLYPARVLRQDGLYGKIAPGYTAQFLVMNKQLEMLSVITS